MVDDTPSTIFTVFFVLLILSILVLFISLVFGALEIVIIALSNYGSQSRLVLFGKFSLASLSIAVSSIGIIYLSSAISERFPILRQRNAINNTGKHEVTKKDAQETVASWDLNSIQESLE